MSDTPTKVKKNEVASFDISSSSNTLELAADLANFIKEKKLFHLIQGKEFVNVEGWMYAGSRLGIVPIVEELTNLSNETEIKYQVKVRLLNLRTEQTVGSGYAICSNKEQGKKFYQEFAIASMAQTRAIGKAYRNILAWIIRAAGYEPTPAEEADGYDDNPKNAKEQPSAVVVVENSPELADLKKQIEQLLKHKNISSELENNVRLKLPSMNTEKANICISVLKEKISPPAKPVETV